MQPIDNFADRILTWFDQHGRKDLPWQMDKTPYRVWISEIMLQQTQVVTVIPYYQKFMTSFPDVYRLADAPEDEVLAHWSGLGYYARARNLHKAAKVLANELDGTFPASLEGVCELSGIGRSTAAAILSISRNEQTAILDGNVKRVLGRFHAIDTWPGEKKTENVMWELAESYMPAERCGDYTQAMMDLGATLCTRSKPQCLFCPIQDDCQALASGTPTDYPIKKPKKSIPTRQTDMLVLQNPTGKVLLEKRVSTGIWGGLWSLPESQDEAITLATEQRFKVTINSLGALAGFRHTFSHYHLEISPYLANVQASNEIGEEGKYQWYTLEEAMALGLPTPVRKILVSLLSDSMS
ncbi:A/G-specific adenine glycosylase [Marinomonas sp. MED121]|uniref:A/G-specific adenine glycosylase n=1 Tax=Marinomonas sp. MED121 TaxID=314277 RepID=UPI00006900BE|nr:A/G-specific adenine glycosylase [Marinomonas sp. MED121]EAQ65722.1 A/G-specific adenine glycosylase [Marinomonas sp. MED121]